MKTKTICKMLLMTAMACTTTNAAAQGVKFGVVGGMNLTKLRISSNAPGAGIFDSANQTGWYVGGKMVLSSRIGLGADVALEYSKRMLDINDDNTASHSLEIPINVRYNIGLGSSLGLYIATGPQLGFALKNMRWNQAISEGVFEKENLTTTWNVGGGVRLFKVLEVGIGYNFALKNAGNIFVPQNNGNAGYDIEYKPNTFQLQAALLF